MINPKNVSKGPCQLNKYCPKPLTKTGIVPAINNIAHIFLSFFDLRKNWKLQKHQKNGIQFNNPIINKFEFQD